MGNLSTPSRLSPAGAWRAHCATFALVLYASCMLLALCVLCAPAHAQDSIPGSLHTSPFPGFASGNGKISNLAIGGGHDYGQVVALQPDGKIVLAGYCSNGIEGDFCVARLNVDGTPDTSFIGPNNSVTGRFLIPVGAGTDYGYTIALQPDGKILLAGGCSNGSNYDFCVARLNANGTLDASFVGPGGASSGKFLLPVGSGDDYVRASVLQPDGKIVLAGHCSNGSNTDFCAVRLNANGTVDASFVGPSAPGPAQYLLPIGTGFDVALAAAQQTDGRIVIAGYCDNGGSNDFCVARLNFDGTLDTSFDGPGGAGNGKFLLPISTEDDYGTAMLLQPDSKIVLIGYCTGLGYAFCGARLNANGTLDARFDGPSGGGAGKFVFPLGGDSDFANATALQPDGKIVIAGACNNGSTFDFCVARLHTDGTLDASFDGPAGTGNGKFAFPMGAGSDMANAIALQADGRIVVVGACDNGSNRDFCIARLNGGPYGAKNCSLDVDGDGKVIATTDLLIATRIALGMTGNAVLGGISFATHATRKTWTDIHSYLVTQCGMAIAQ